MLSLKKVRAARQCSPNNKFVLHQQQYRQIPVKPIGFHQTNSSTRLVRSDLKRKLSYLKNVLIDTNPGNPEHFAAVRLYRSTVRQLRRLNRVS